MEYSAASLSYLEILYKKLEAYTQHLSNIHKDRLKCQKGCFSCCVDNLEVLGLEAAYIQQKYPQVLSEEKGPLGACAFLDGEGACRVYFARPFICRTHGLPLNLEVEENGQVFDILDICELNETEIPLSDLPEEHILNVKTFEQILLGLQIDADKGSMHRVKLREMFVNQ